ncbi:hypothetical protein [Pseudoalteromonas sp. PPB1]|uniref:hypothetical protein n=1 Tax=Pseudoalteromonas sp. PPB1 TaxID=2756136 RepID=UPI0018919385|nr:hypothetical protein [Pseudoalteromonas sp. PPB1]
MKKLSLFSLFILLPFHSLAGASFTGTIKQVVCHTKHVSPLCQIQVNGNVSNQTCGTQAWKFSFDATTPEGKNMLSILLAAQIGKQQITLGGTGSCSLATASEDLRHAYITTN